LGTMTTTGPGFSFQVYGSKGWLRLEGLTHVAGASSEERRMRLFGTCKLQPVKGDGKVWEAAGLDVTRAALEAFARAAAEIHVSAFLLFVPLPLVGRGQGWVGGTMKDAVFAL
ncbi:MAG TPA: hypothetical protein VEK75_14120, partial [Xanthobacteraceae bacterium]|nr:hypothetical protein [Xanthobacteraceae bacterium]